MVKVGTVDSDEKVLVHKDILRECSSYFRAVFDGNFKEAVHQEVTLELDRTTSLAFVRWLYKRDKERYELLMTRPISLLLCLWVFADEKGIPTLQSNITHVLVDRATLGQDRSNFPFPPKEFVRIFNLNDIDYVYDNTGK